MNPNTPIHEYTHLWAEALRQNNQETWRKIVNALKGTPQWERMKNNPNYSDLVTDDSIADELLSRLTAEHGVKLLKNASVLSKIKAALTRFWHGVANMLGFKFTNLEDVYNRVLADLYNEQNPMNFVKKASSTTRFDKGTPSSEQLAKAHEYIAQGGRHVRTETKKPKTFKEKLNHCFLNRT